MEDTPLAPGADSRQARTGARLHSETRTRLVRAAAAEFSERNYARATVGRIAASAGVTVQTLYSAWGSKRDLLRGVLTTALADDQDPTARFLDQMGAAGASTAVERFVEIFLAVAARAGDVWVVYEDAAAVDQEIAADWQDLQERRRRTVAALLGTIPPDALRLPIQDAVDTVWAIASPQTWRLLVRRGGLTPAQYGAWLRSTLRRLLTDD